MANQDSSQYTLRYNEITAELEFAQGNYWVPISLGGGGTPAGPDTSIQFNNAGSFGGSANLTFDGHDFEVVADTGMGLTVNNDLNITMAPAMDDNELTAHADLYTFRTTAGISVQINETELTIADDMKVIMGNGGLAFLQYNSGAAAFLFSDGASGDPTLAAPRSMSLVANDGFDGSGAASPAVVIGDSNVGGDVVQLTCYNGGTVFINSASPSNAPIASAILAVKSTTQGFLPPRMDSTQRDAISSPEEGLTVYNTTTHTLNFWNGSAWTAV